MNLFICQTIAIGCGYILDLLIGDPHWLYHPVRLIGNLISLLESILLKKKIHLLRSTERVWYLQY